jgi:hypothetical protein
MDQKGKPTGTASDAPPSSANGAQGIVVESPWLGVLAAKPAAALIERRRRDLGVAISVSRLFVDFLEGYAQSQIDCLLQVAQAASSAANVFAGPRTGVTPDEVYRKMVGDALDLTRAKLNELSGLTLEMNAKLAEMVENQVAATMDEVSEAMALGLRAMGQERSRP